jgi:hypothetical protein
MARTGQRGRTPGARRRLGDLPARTLAPPEALWLVEWVLRRVFTLVQAPEEPRSKQAMRTEAQRIDEAALAEMCELAARVESGLPLALRGGVTVRLGDVRLHSVRARLREVFTAEAAWCNEHRREMAEAEKRSRRVAAFAAEGVVLSKAQADAVGAFDPIVQMAGRSRGSGDRKQVGPDFAAARLVALVMGRSVRVQDAAKPVVRDRFLGEPWSAQDVASASLRGPQPSQRGLLRFFVEKVLGADAKLWVAVRNAWERAVEGLRPVDARIRSPEVAEKVSLLLISIMSGMARSIEWVREGSADDLRWYTNEASKVMLAAIELANQIYITHPQLKPKQIGGTYEVEVAPEVFEPEVPPRRSRATARRAKPQRK